MNEGKSEGKLVRDGIPRIIREGGGEPLTHVADPVEYRLRLRDKLGEEVAEFLAADEATAVEELADVLEVVRALAADLGVTPERLDAVRAAKAKERGGFGGRIVWAGNAESGRDA
jgi:predicted house-cleaning noncanonical NTP pyrophosphatase (MazG superfamily)